jgi:hypothetical protein
LLSETVAVPLPVAAAVIVTVWAKVAVSVSPDAAENLQGLVVPVHVPPDQPVKRLPEAAVSVIVIESPTSARQLVTPEQPATELASVMVAVPAPVPSLAPAAVAVLIVTVTAKLAVSVSVAEAVKVHGLATALQVPPDQLASRFPDLAVGVIVIESPTSATQLLTPLQPARESESLSVAVPFPATATEMVTVLEKLAVSVSALAALNLQGLVVPEQVPPDQPVKRLPDDAVGVIVIASPTSATQLVTPLQPASELASLIVAVPLPLTDVAIVTVLAKLAVSVSAALALKVQGLAVPEQVPPDQPVKRLPDDGVGVIVIASPTSARQLVTPLQPASELESLIFAVPLPAPASAVLIVTVLTKVAVSVSALDAVNVHGLDVPLQVPPDQPVKR